MIELKDTVTMPSGREKSRFDVAMPGQSLTKASKSYPWESPPQFTEPDDVMDFYFDRFEDEETLFNMFALLEAKVPVSRIVDSMLLHGFSEGLYTPDVAILVAEDLMMSLAVIAQEADIDYELGGGDATKQAFKKATELKNALKEREDAFMPKVEEKIEELKQNQPSKGLMGPRETE